MLLHRTVPLFALAIILSAATLASACPFCSAPTLTLSEQIAQSDAVALVQWVSGKEADPDEGFAGSTTYEVLQVVTGADQVKPDERITLSRHRAGQEGDLFLLTGNINNDAVEWGSPLEVTEASFQYIVQAPSPEAPQIERLKYFLKFLENPQSMVANDAYAEFAKAPYKDIKPLSDKLPTDKIREWVFDPETDPTRLGLYGLLLGLSGNENDAELMKDKILEATEKFRLGIDGVIGGYLLLAGEDGLEAIEQAKLKDTTVPFSETYAAMQALRFLWDYGDGAISKERLRQSMRILLDRPEIADLVIADLARWEDWTLVDQLRDLYDAEEYDVPSIKRAIVRYFLVAAKSKDESGTPIAAAAKAQKYLAELRESDPDTVQKAERFFFIN